MWTEDIQRIDQQCLKLALRYKDQKLSFAQLINRWKEQRDFAVFFNDVLARLPFEAFFWELPALTLDSLGRDFECVVIDSSALAGMVCDRGAFQEYFASASQQVCCFNNLGGDAQLVVPVPLDETSAYAHIAAFCRSAPVSQQCALWREVGKLCSQQLGEQPLWLNTCGLGVSWTHVRLDSYPKYYSYLPYKQSL